MSDNDIQLRLRRVEGQIRGLQRMVEEENACEQILTQLLAARSALDQVGLLIVDSYVQRCLLSGNETGVRDKLQKIFSLVLTRYSLNPLPDEAPLSPHDRQAWEEFKNRSQFAPTLQEGNFHE